MRLATGMQRVTGGDIYGIDAESRRMCHYADIFKFQHVPFGAPFGSLDYLAAIEYCVKKGAGTIIIDSMSHEHEGPGGLLEYHEAELTRIAGDDQGKRDRCQMLAWQKPKAARRRLINTILQMPINFIFCFRAKEKIKIRPGKQPEQLGWMPIAGEEFVYEMMVNALLLPNAGGVPTWASNEVGEKQMIKLPQQFRKLLIERNTPLDETIGETMAKWAAGDQKTPETMASRVEKMLPKFAAQGVTKEMIEQRIGHEVAKIDEKELASLVDVFKTIAADENRKSEFFPEKNGEVFDADGAEERARNFRDAIEEASSIQGMYTVMEDIKARLEVLGQKLSDELLGRCQPKLTELLAQKGNK